MPRIATYLSQRFAGEGLLSAVRDEALRVCTAFTESGFADSKFAAELTSGSEAKFWSCMSEALIFDRLRGLPFAPRSAAGAGPDFLLLDGDRRIWIEVVCPEPVGLPAGWREIRANAVGTVPHDAILLRWTSAIKEKSEKLLGRADGKFSGYLRSGVVSAEDVYVIAVNGCQLRHGPFAALHGISQFPYAAEAVFPIGPYQLRIDRETLKCVGTGYQERFHITKPNGAMVPSHAFLDPCHGMVAAIWAVDFDGRGVIGSAQPSALIHNPIAAKPLSLGFLPCDEEYVAAPAGEGEYIFQRVGGIAEGDG